MMGFRDLFISDWKYPDPGRRLNAVKRTTSKTILAEVAKNDEIYLVRRVAVMKLADDLTHRTGMMAQNRICTIF
jgi:hypothetical protein